MVRIVVRRDTAANWTSANPTLAAGEIGFETDTGKFKIGNGSTAWTSLGYKEGVTDHTLLSNIGTNSHEAIDLFIASKGQNSGLAPLDASGKVATTYLPASIVGSLEYKGAHDCSGGSYPSAPETGWYYVCSVAGTISGTPYAIGDWMVYNGTTWDKIDNTDAVASVDGMTGAVSLSGTYIGIPGSSAQGDILIRNGSGWTRLPASATAGYLLQSNGAGQNPAWNYIDGGNASSS